MNCKYCDKALESGDFASIPACRPCVDERAKSKEDRAVDQAKARKVKQMRAIGKWKK